MLEYTKEEKEMMVYMNAKGNESLLSFLYDLNLMPEQLEYDSHRWNMMILTITAYRTGKESK